MQTLLVASQIPNAIDNIFVQNAKLTKDTLETEAKQAFELEGKYKDVIANSHGHDRAQILQALTKLSARITEQRDTVLRDLYLNTTEQKIAETQALEQAKKTPDANIDNTYLKGETARVHRYVTHTTTADDALFVEAFREREAENPAILAVKNDLMTGVVQDCLKSTESAITELSKHSCCIL